jgi:hypothetical protein
MEEKFGTMSFAKLFKNRNFIFLQPLNGEPACRQGSSLLRLLADSADKAQLRSVLKQNIGNDLK